VFQLVEMLHSSTYSN